MIDQINGKLACSLYSEHGYIEFLKWVDPQFVIISKITRV